MIQINYSDKISIFPKRVENIGRIKSPTLRSIFDITVEKYNLYLNYLRMTPKIFLDVNNITDKDITSYVLSLPNIYPLITNNIQDAEFYCEIFEFFLDNEVKYNVSAKVFEVIYQDQIYGYINDTNFQNVSDAIAKMNNLSIQETVENLKFKNEKARELYMLLEVNKKEKPVEENKNMVIENVISSVCAIHASYNMLNIWDLTVCQLYDQFFKLCVNIPFLINSVRWAAWGEKEYQYDVWYRKTE